MRKPIVVCAALLVVCVAALAQQRDFDKVEIVAEPLRGPVHMLTGAGGNIGVSAGEDGILIVDDQFAPLAEKITEALGKLGAGKPRFILNTHHHADHTGGNEHFGAEGVIVAHENVRKRLEKDQPKNALPVVTYHDSVSIHFNGEEIQLIHLGPGHTDGDSVVVFTKSNVVHMGDLFFKDRFPFVDLNSGGSVEGYIQNVAAALEKYVKDDTKIIPGHGALATRADLQRFYDTLAETAAIVRKAMAEGKSLDEIQAAGLPEKYNEWGSGFIKADLWIETIYKSYSSVGQSDHPAIRPGEALVNGGLIIKPERPKFPMVAAFANLKNIRVTVAFNQDGEVVKASLLDSTGTPKIDGQILASLFRWKAEGDALPQNEGELLQREYVILFSE